MKKKKVNRKQSEGKIQRSQQIREMLVKPVQGGRGSTAKKSKRKHRGGEEHKRRQHKIMWEMKQKTKRDRESK